MTTDYLREMLKHLPPSSSTLRLVDVSDPSILRDIQHLRPDVEAVPTSKKLADLPEYSVDAVVGYHHSVNKADHPILLREARQALRPGGRLILLEKSATTLEGRAQLLEQLGYARILTETLDDLLLSRGEKPHGVGLSTHQRIATATSDTAPSSPQILQGQDLQNAPGRYLHLLIKQLPNKPAWALGPSDVIRWQAVALPASSSELQTVLAFSSLPQAVSFMQKAVVEGLVRDVSKIAKFSHTTGAAWPFTVWLNPTPEAIHDSQRLPATWIEIDHTTAEAPDE